MQLSISISRYAHQANANGSHNLFLSCRKALQGKAAFRYSLIRSKTTSSGSVTHTGLSVGHATNAKNIQSVCVPRLCSAVQQTCLGQRIPLWRLTQNQAFHTSPRRNIPPIIWVFFKPVAKLFAAVGGRSVRKWYKRLKPDEKQEVWERIRHYWLLWTGLFAGLGGLGYMYYQSHIQLTPFTGRKRFMALTHEQVLSIADEESKQLVAKFDPDQFYKAEDIQFKRTLDVVARIIAANADLRDTKFQSWTLFVVKHEAINACVLPNGHIFVFEGMLKVANTQDQLAVVIGHELAHALLEHGVEELSHGQLVDSLIIILMAAVWCILPFDGIALVTQWFQNRVVHLLTTMPHSRMVEKEADKVGLMLSAKACFDVRDGSTLWRKVHSIERMANGQDELPLPEFLSTHPDSLRRAEHLDFLESQVHEWRKENKCPPLPTSDPRKLIETILNDMVVAHKAGQNLRKVRKVPGHKAMDSQTS